jgi:hypothetical protein
MHPGHKVFKKAGWIAVDIYILNRKILSQTVPEDLGLVLQVLG